LCLLPNPYALVAHGEDIRAVKLLQRNPPVLSWGCRLYSGCKMIVCLSVCSFVKIQYLDLDLTKSKGGDTGTVEKSPRNRYTQYEEIDWLKTRALTDTRQAVEKERKFSDRSLDD